MPRKIKKAQLLDVDIERSVPRKTKKAQSMIKNISLDACVYMYTKNNSDKNA